MRVLTSDRADLILSIYSSFDLNL